jgi:uncharacterized protein (DUF697 family)
LTVLVLPAGMPDVPALALGLVARAEVLAFVVLSGPILGCPVTADVDAWGFVVDLGMWARKGTMT